MRVDSKLRAELELSAKGQVVLPGPIRRKLAFRAGDPLGAKVEADRIVLTPNKARLQKVHIIEDPVTGLPVLTAGPDAPRLTGKQVADNLADFR